jgi:probable O-glycosylation ligase (exosortase A-associated)
MRDLILTAMITALTAMALRHTWIGALLWTWLSLMNPHRLTWGFAYALPFAQVAAVAAFISMLWNRHVLRLPADALVFLLMAFSLWMCVSTVFALMPEPSADLLIRALKIQVMTLVCIAAIRERKHIELFVWVNVLSVGFYGFKGGLFALATGGSYRVWGPEGSFIQDNNALGLALVMIIPLGYYLWQQARRHWLRWGLGLFLLMNAVAVLSTQSRGALLGIAAMSLVLWTHMRRKAWGAVALAAASLALLAFMPDSWSERMRTIGDYEQDTSAMARINAWQTALNIANDRITGAGFSVAHPSIFQSYSPRPDWVFTAHSIYFQPLGELGWIGLALFLSIGAFGFWNAGRIRRQALQREDTRWVHDLAGMIQVSMVGYAVGGAFLSLSYWDLPYNFIVMLLAMKYWLAEERWKDEPARPLGAAAPMAP